MLFEKIDYDQIPKLAKEMKSIFSYNSLIGIQIKK